MEHHAHVPSLIDLAWPTANFVVFVVFLVRQLSGPLREYFRTRSERLREELAAGDRARTEAAALRAALQKDLTDLPAVRERLKADLRATAERERDQLLAQGRQAAERIANDAKLLAEQEVATARRTLRDETVAAAVREATSIVRSATSAPDQERFVGDFIGNAGATA